MNNSLPYLSVLLGWPVLGALLILFIQDSLLARRWTLLVASLELIFSLAMLSGFDSQNSGWQFQEEYLWLPSLNSHYQLAVDGISVGFLPITALLSLLTLLSSQSFSRLQLAMLLGLEAVTVGIFSALDLLLFFLFWELSLPAIFILIAWRGLGPQAAYVASKYTLFMLFAGVPLLFGILLVASNYAGQHGGEWSFSLPLLLATPMALDQQTWVFGLLLLAFAVKAPLFPFHTWLPSVALQAPTQLTAVLIGLKLGVYGIIRLAMPLAPQAALDHLWFLAILGAVTLVYAALIALRQTNFRALLAYASISHVGMLMMALAAFNALAMQGVLLQLLNFALIAGSLMLMAGMLERRLGTNDLTQLGGLARPMPRFTVLLFLFVLASIGVPGSNGFVAELLMLLGVVDRFAIFGLVALFTAVLAAAYSLQFIKSSVWGPLKQPHLARSPDLLAREVWVLLVPAILVLLIGLMPQPVLNLQKAAIDAWLEQLNQPRLLLSEMD